MTETLVFGHYHKIHMASTGPNVSGPIGPVGPIGPPGTDEVFRLKDYVEFPGFPGPLFQIVGGEEPFWELEHVGGPKPPRNYHRTFFGENPPDTGVVIESILAHVNEMKVLAIFASEEPE